MNQIIIGDLQIEMKGDIMAHQPIDIITTKTRKYKHPSTRAPCVDEAFLHR